jgi:hypothetical protein
MPCPSCHIISKPVPQRGADRLVHRITPAGRRELDDWLMRASTRPAGYRDDFILKLLAASRRGPDDIRDVCQVEREARMADLGALRELRRAGAGNPVTVIALEIAVIHVQADLKAIDLAEAHADDRLPARADAELTEAASEIEADKAERDKAAGRQAG